MITRHISVVAYDSGWVAAFQKIRTEIASALGSLALSIEHVGSTSVPGLAAKPVIDIDVVIENAGVFAQVCDHLSTVGYSHVGDQDIPGREVFKYLEKPHLMKHHLYVCARDSVELKRHLAFRDYLRAHPEAVSEYSRIKVEGARLFPDDIDAYILHKTPFIQGLLKIIMPLEK